MTVDLNFLASLITTLGVIGTPIFFIIRKIMFIVTKLEKNTEDIYHHQLENTVILKGTLACLKGLQEMGCNGPVTKAITDIEEYLIKTR